jgi:hypothetical protein
VTATLSVRGDIRAVLRDLKHLERTVVPRATATALNRTNERVRTQIVKGLSGSLGILQKRVRRRVILPRALRATRHKLTASGLTLFTFVPEIYRLRTVEARREAQGPNRFIATMPSGHVGLFRRRGPTRLPIQEILIDLSARTAREAAAVVNTQGRGLFRTEFARALRRHLRRR